MSLRDELNQAFEDMRSNVQRIESYVDLLGSSLRSLAADINNAQTQLANTAEPVANDIFQDNATELNFLTYEVGRIQDTIERMRTDLK